MNRFFHEKNRTFWYGGAIFYTATIIFLVVSLVSYNVTDSSWLYISSDPEAITNTGGFLGAQFAAILFYLFGGASFLLLIPLLCGGFIFFTQKSMKNEWERLFASVYLVFVGAALLAAYSMDVAVSPYPGGMVGLRFANALVYYFDPIGRMLFLYSSLCASFILLFRWSFMFLFQYAMWAVLAAYALMCKYHVVSKTVHAVGVCMYAVFLKMPRFFVHFVQSLLDGEAFDETGLLHPDDDYDFGQQWDADRSDEIQFDEVSINYVVLYSGARGYPSTSSGRARKNKVSRLKLNLVPPLISLRHAVDKKVNNDMSEYTASVRVQKAKHEKQLPTISKKTSRYALPHMDIFIAEKDIKEDRNVEKELQERAQVLQDKLKRFGVTW